MATYSNPVSQEYLDLLYKKHNNNNVLPNDCPYTVTLKKNGVIFYLKTADSTLSLHTTGNCSIMGKGLKAVENFNNLTVTDILGLMSVCIFYDQFDMLKRLFKLLQFNAGKSDGLLVQTKLKELCLSGQTEQEIVITYRTMMSSSEYYIPPAEETIVEKAKKFEEPPKTSEYKDGLLINTDNPLLKTINKELDSLYTKILTDVKEKGFFEYKTDKMFYFIRRINGFTNENVEIPDMINLHFRDLFKEQDKDKIDHIWGNMNELDKVAKYTVSLIGSEVTSYLNNFAKTHGPQ